MTSPDEQVIEALKYLGGYIKSHKEDGVTLGNKNAWGSDTLLSGLSDASFHDDGEEHTSTGGYIINSLGTTLINRSFRVKAVCLSTTEAEIYALSACSQHVERFRRVLQDLGELRESWGLSFTKSEIPYLGSSTISKGKLLSDQYLGRDTFVGTDSLPALRLANKDTDSPRIRHIAIHRAFIVELVRTLRLVGILHVGTTVNAADVNTKALSQELTEKHGDVIYGKDMPIYETK